MLGINAIILPPPSIIIFALAEDLPYITLQLGYTAFESLSGSISASIFGFALAIWYAYINTGAKIILPYAITIKSTSLVAINPLLVIWFGSGITSKVIMSFLVAFFPILVSTYRGLQRVDNNWIELATSVNAKINILIQILIQTRYHIFSLHSKSQVLLPAQMQPLASSPKHWLVLDI